MIDCHLSSKNEIIKTQKFINYQFEPLGFDFMIDSHLRVWLIEVNTCPYMGPVLEEYHPDFMADFLDDTFKLTIDRYFDFNPMSLDEIEEKTKYELLWS